MGQHPMVTGAISKAPCVARRCVLESSEECALCLSQQEQPEQPQQERGISGGRAHTFPRQYYPAGLRRFRVETKHGGGCSRPRSTALGPGEYQQLRILRRCFWREAVPGHENVRATPRRWLKPAEILRSKARFIGCRHVARRFHRREI